MLYDRTFNEIMQSNIKKNTSILSINSSKESNIKSLIEFIVSLTTMIFTININLKYKWMQNILKFGSIIWVVILTFKIIIKFSHELSISDEISRKSLYDDEIAELQLIDILKDLNELNYNVVIVLDELDKIENEDDINNIISEFKPLLISDLATFIVISGQRLYYQLSNSSIVDDSLISSIFSKTIHTPLSSHNILNGLFSNCIVDSDIEDNIKNKYIDSVILRSNTTIRLFINIISQDIIWDKNKSYIHIKSDDVGKFETDSKILRAIGDVVKENLNPFTDLDMAIKDFFICQLYLWAKKMKLINKDKFHINDILNFDKDYSDKYPRWCEIQLNSLLNNLLKKLINSEKIIEKEEQENDEGKVILYKWVDGIEINEESEMEKIAKLKMKYLDDFIIVEKYCKEIETVINSRVRSRVFNDTIRNLLEFEIIDKNIYNELKIFSQLRNKIVHGENVGDIKKYNLNISQMTNILIDKYSYYILKNYLENRKYTLHVNSKIDMECDFIAKSNDTSIDDILIEVKYRKYLSKSNIRELANNTLLKIDSYGYEKQFKLIVLVFTEERINNQRNHIDETFSKGNFIIIYISNILSLDIEGYLDNIIESENDDKYNEIAYTT